MKTIDSFSEYKRLWNRAEIKVIRSKFQGRSMANDTGQFQFQTEGFVEWRSGPRYRLVIAARKLMSSRGERIPKPQEIWLCETPEIEAEGNMRLFKKPDGNKMKVDSEIRKLVLFGVQRGERGNPCRGCLGEHGKVVRGSVLQSKNKQ